MQKKYVYILLLFIVLNLSGDVIDKWKINVGSMFVTNFETDMQLSPKNIPISFKINTKDQLGMKNDTNVFRLDGYYRFTDIHSISFSYFSIKSDGYLSIDKELEWDDSTISAGALVKSFFDMDVYKFNYGYSFYHNEKVELLISAGAHITTVSLGLTAEGTIDGISNQSSVSSASATLPLPVFGFKGEYTIIDKKLFVNYQTEYFFIGFDKYKGTLTTSALSLEYRFLEHVSVGLGYNTNKIIVEMDDGDKKMEIKNSLSGIMLYCSYIY